MKLYLHSTNKNSKHLEYEVLSYNKETNMGMLVNVHGKTPTKFESNLSKEVLIKNKWVVSKKSYADIEAESSK